MNSRQFPHSSRCTHILAAIAFVSMAGCVIQVAPMDQPPQSVEAPPPPDQSAYAQPAADPALQQLVSPIALYPDPILADVLPASTYPDQVQAAAQFVQADPSAPDDEIAGQNWDPSVQALAHYPSVLQYMASNPDWTASLGSAFVNEQPQVMEAIQDLRAQAQAEGNLQTTEYEYVVDDGGFIYIRPAEDGTIIIPYYDPVLVYREHYNIDYRYHYRDGAWLDHGFDWQHHDVYTGDWHNSWTGGPGNWHRNAGWQPPQQHWAHDDRRFGPVRQIAPAHYTQPREVQGRDFHAAPARQAAPANRQQPQHVQQAPSHQEERVQPQQRDEPRPAPAPVQQHDQRIQSQQHTDQKPAEHSNPQPAAQQHASHAEPAHQAPPAKSKEPDKSDQGK